MTEQAHTHPWPKKVTDTKVYACPDCGLEVLGADIKRAREESK